MTILEKVAYLKGLADGLEIDESTKEGKVFSAIFDILSDVATTLSDIEENALDLGEEIDEISDDLALVESIILDDDFDDEDDCGCGDDCECGCGCDDCHSDFPLLFEVTCPSCENSITVDEEVLDLGTIQCPNCAEMLEFDLDDIAVDVDEDKEGTEQE